MKYSTYLFLVFYINFNIKLQFNEQAVTKIKTYILVYKYDMRFHKKIIRPFSSLNTVDLYIACKYWNLCSNI